MILNKEQYDVLRKHYHAGEAAYEAFRREIAEYERANPPTPQVVCPACGAEMIPLNTSEHAWWACTRDGCKLGGPYDDPDGSKVMALCRRKLPIKPPFVALEGMAYPIIDYRIPKAGELVAVPGMRARPCPIETAAKEIKTAILGDPIDIAEWFDE